MTTINRDDYMDGKVDHQTYYCAVADAIGRNALESIVRSITYGEDIVRCLERDKHLNNIPLRRWDARDQQVRDLVSLNAKAVMDVSWNGPIKPGTFCWSLSDTVCTLKAVARRMAEESIEAR